MHQSDELPEYGMRIYIPVTKSPGPTTPTMPAKAPRRLRNALRWRIRSIRQVIAYAVAPWLRNDEWE